MTNTVISRVAFAVATFLPVTGFSAELAAPTGPVLLTISGAIENSNSENGTASFDLEMLRALGSETIETSTIWTEGDQSFEGVSLSVLMDAVGATGDVLQATAKFLGDTDMRKAARVMLRASAHAILVFASSYGIGIMTKWPIS